MNIERPQVVIEIGVADRAGATAAGVPVVDESGTRRELLRENIRVTHRDGSIVRVQPDGRIDRVVRVEPGVAIVATERVLVVVTREDMGRRGGEVIALRLVGPTDHYRFLTLPPWLAAKDEPIDLALASEHVVVLTPKRIAWMPTERLNWLARVGNARIKFCARSATTEDVSVVVTRGGETRAVVEGASGKRIMLMTQAVPVVLGERLLVREVGGALSLVNAAGERVAHDDTIELVRTPPPATSGYPDHDTFCQGELTAADFAASVLKPHVRGLIADLGKFGIVPPIDREALEDAVMEAFRANTVPRRHSLAAAQILYAYLRAHPLPESRALLGDDAIDRASRENAALGETRWHLVTMLRDEPFALCLSPAKHRVITSRELLLLEPVPPYGPPPADAEAVRAKLAELVGAADPEVRVEATPRGSIALRLSVRAAALLDRSWQLRD